MPGKRQRGERAGLTREQILDAGLELVDEAGLGGLTMRGLGARLGVEAMTLYHYAPNKDALVDGMVERLFTAAQPELADGDWRAGLGRYAHELRAALLRHPGILPAVARPAVTPATLDAVEAGLRVLTGAGFPIGTAVDALNTLSLFVIGHAAAEVGIPSGGAGAGSPGWLADLPRARYPLLLRAVHEGAGTDDAARFGFAVDALLTGFAAALPSA